MAINFELSQTIGKPIEEVFLFVGDFSNMPYWNYYIQTVTKISGGDTGVGSIFEMKRPHDLNTYKITGFDAPGKITVELQPPGPQQQLIFELSSNGKQTNVIYKWHLDLEK